MNDIWQAETERQAAAVRAGREAQERGEDVVEVIETSYQSGAVWELIRPWDGLPSQIGSIQPRDGRRDGKRVVSRPEFELWAR